MCRCVFAPSFSYSFSFLCPASKLSTVIRICGDANLGQHLQQLDGAIGFCLQRVPFDFVLDQRRSRQDRPVEAELAHRRSVLKDSCPLGQSRQDDQTVTGHGKIVTDRGVVVAGVVHRADVGLDRLGGRLEKGQIDGMQLLGRHVTVNPVCKCRKWQPGDVGRAKLLRQHIPPRVILQPILHPRDWQQLDVTVWLARPRVRAAIEESVELAVPVVPPVRLNAGIRCRQVIGFEKMVLLLEGLGSQDEVFGDYRELVQDQVVARLGQVGNEQRALLGALERIEGFVWLVGLRSRCGRLVC